MKADKKRKNPERIKIKEKILLQQWQKEKPKATHTAQKIPTAFALQPCTFIIRLAITFTPFQLFFFSLLQRSMNDAIA